MIHVRLKTICNVCSDDEMFRIMIEKVHPDASVMRSKSGTIAKPEDVFIKQVITKAFSYFDSWKLLFAMCKN